jgi:hypothetical protein
MTGPGPEPDRRAELVALVRVDYEATRSLIDGVVRTSIALRAVGMALTLALLGFATAQSSLVVALCGLATTLLFLYLDAYHGWLYDEGRRRARYLEHVLGLRYKQLERGDDDPAATGDLDLALASHHFGQYSTIPRFRPAFLLKARPRAIYYVVYGSLSILAVGAAIYGAVT